MRTFNFIMCGVGYLFTANLLFWFAFGIGAVALERMRDRRRAKHEISELEHMFYGN